jgi:hypothetical protein
MAARSGDARIMARSLALLGVSAPPVALAWLALPTHHHVPVAGAIACIGITLALSAVAFSGLLDDAPPWVFQALLALITLIIAPAIYWTADEASVFALLYVWATPYAYCWFSLRHAALQTSFACVCYLGALSLSQDLPGETIVDHLADVLLLGSTIAAVGLFARSLVRNLRRQERLRAHRAGVLAEFGRSSLDAVDLQRVLDEGVRTALCELGADFVVLAEVVGDGTELRVAAIAGPHGHASLARGDRFPGGGQSLLGHAIRSGEPVTTEDVRTDERIELSPALAHFGVRAGIGVAVQGRTGRRLGIGVYRTSANPVAAHDPT